jgi:hypothetical protein
LNGWLQVNFKKCTFIVFGKNKEFVSSITVASHVMRACNSVKLLGLRIDSNLSYSTHVNYVISRIKQVRVMLVKLSHVFDFHIRQYLVKALVFPIVNLYDFIYASASSSCLRRLDVSYNDLMRAILGIRRSIHFTIADLHKCTALDNLRERRQESLAKFMQDVVEERIHTRLRLLCVKRSRLYSTRVHSYIVPRFNTNIGRQRIVVRGLSLLNELNHINNM